MGKAEEIIRKYAEAKEPVEGFGFWLLADRDSAEKEEALSGLWRRLEATQAEDDAFLRRAKLLALMKRIPREEVVSTGRRWFWTLPVAAASALGLFLLMPHTKENGSLYISDQPKAQIVDDISEVPEDNLVGKMSASAPVLAQGMPSSPFIRIPVHSQYRSAAVTDAGQSEPIIPVDKADSIRWGTLVSESEEESPEVGSASESPVNDSSIDSKIDNAAVAAQWSALEKQDRLDGQKKNRSLSVGLQSSGGLLASVSSRSITVTPGQIISFGDDWPSLGSQSLEFPSGTELKEKTRYDIPLRAGVSIFLPLNERISFGTGLAITLLHSSSSFSSSSSSMNLSKDTRFRYLGIPLRLRYQLVPSDWGSLYGTSGVEADYLLRRWSATSSYESVVDTFSKHPLQLSAHIGIGYEYVIYRRWSFYVEASLDYYLKNNSTLNTYFRQNPFIPSVTFEIQYTLSR